jgi:hypothetical protein
MTAVLEHLTKGPKRQQLCHDEAGSCGSKMANTVELEEV